MQLAIEKALTNQVMDIATAKKMSDEFKTKLGL
jgi:hypothetical protein